MRIPYRRRPSPVPNTTNSRKGKVIADTEFLKLPEKRSPVQKAQPGMPPRARKSQPKSLQYRPKSAQPLPEEPMSPKSTQCHPKKLLSAPGIFAACYRLRPPTPRGWVEVAGCHRMSPYTRKAPYIAVKCFSWSGKRGSDPRPQPWQGCALPTELFPQYNPVPRGWDYKGTEFFLNCKLFLNFFVRVCSRVAEYGFAVFAVYHNLAVLAYFTFKDFLCKLVDQLSLNQSFDRTGTIFRIVAVLYHVVFKGFRE